MTLRNRVQIMERRIVAADKHPRDMTAAELERAVTDSVGYLPDVVELRRLIDERPEGGAKA
jgi:hypothetical protein